MVKKITLYFVLAAVIMATGCPKNLPKADFSTDTNSRNYVVNQLKQNVYYNEWIKFDCSRRGYQYSVDYRTISNGGKQNNNVGESITCSSTDKNPNGLTEAAHIRDSVLNNGRGLIDQVYVKYASAIAERRSTANFLADLAELGAGAAAGTVKGPARALNLIGVFLTAFRGGRQSAEINFYNEIPTNTLINEMNAARETILGDITAKKRLDANEYDFDAALSDLVLYLYEGSLLSASTRLNRDSAVKAQVAEARRKELEKIPTTPIITQADFAVGKEITQELKDLEDDCDSDLANTGTIERSTRRYNLIVLNLIKNQQFAGIISKLREDKEFRNIIEFYLTPPSTTPTNTTTNVNANAGNVNANASPFPTSAATSNKKSCADLIAFVNAIKREINNMERESRSYELRKTFKEIIIASKTAE